MYLASCIIFYLTIHSTYPPFAGKLGTIEVPGKPPLTCVMTLYVSPDRGRATRLSPNGGSTPIPRFTDAFISMST